MDAQAYSVAVRVGAEDNLSRVLMAISQDAIKLHERFQQINKDLQGITASANKAATAFKNMTNAANGQFTGATRDAKAYADAMDRAARSSTTFATASSNASRAGTGMSAAPYLALGYMGGIGGRTPSQSMISFNGGDSIPPQLWLASGGGGRGTGIGPFGATGDYIPGGGGRGPSGRSGNIYDADFDHLSPPGGNSPPPNPPKNDGGHNHGMSAHDAGMTNLMTGYFGFEFLDDAAKRGLEYERSVARLRQMGLSKQQVSDAENFVNSTDIKNTSVLDRMRIFTDAQGSFRQSGMTGPEALLAAKNMTPVLANYEVAMTALGDNTKSATIANLKNLTKTVEIMGGTNDIKRAVAVSDAVFKASQSSGGLVDERQLKHFVSYGSSAVNAQSLRAIFGGLEPIIGEFGGMQTATGLTTAYRRTNGMLSLPPKILDREMARLGIADKTGKEQTKDLAYLQATDAIAYAHKLMEIYKKHGITTQIDVERENAIILGGTGSKIYNRIMAQMKVLWESETNYDREHGASQVDNDPDNHQLLARQNLETKWEDLQLALAKDGGVLDTFTHGVDYLGVALNKITKEMNDHPELAKLVTHGAMAVIALAGVSGGIWLLNHAANGILKPLGWLVGDKGFTLLNTRIASLPGVLTLAMEAMAVGAIASSANEIYRRVKAAREGRPYDQIVGQNAEMKELDRLKRLNWSQGHPGVPYPGGQIGVLSEMPPRPGISPAPVPGKQPVMVNLTVQNIVDGKVMSETVIKHLAREANKPPMGTSSFDASMGLLFSGMNSQQFPR